MNQTQKSHEVDTSNEEMAQLWDGPEGDSWTENEDHFYQGGREYDPHMFREANIQVQDNVLDIGCGCGQSTRKAAHIAKSGQALGVDLSSKMIARAKERATEEKVMNADFKQVDAQSYHFKPDHYDVVISRFGAMFFGDPVKAFSNIRRAMKPGGRMVLIAWRDPNSNEWLARSREIVAAGRKLPTAVPSEPGPFGLADESFSRKLLEEAGFENIEFTALFEPFLWGKDAADAYHYVTGMAMFKRQLAGLDKETQSQVLQNLKKLMQHHETKDGVLFKSSVWLIKALNK